MELKNIINNLGYSTTENHPILYVHVPIKGEHRTIALNPYRNKVDIEFFHGKPGDKITPSDYEPKKYLSSTGLDFLRNHLAKIIHTLGKNNISVMYAADKKHHDLYNYLLPKVGYTLGEHKVLGNSHSAIWHPKDK